jgi:hypothetical protein
MISLDQARASLIAVLTAGRCCQTNANRSPKSTADLSSGGEFTPFGQSRGSVLLECFSAV